MLSKRFEDDGKLFCPLDGSQLMARAAFLRKCLDGHYQFEAIRCLCRSSTEKAILMSRKDRYGMPIDTWLCKHCGMIYSSPYFTPESCNKFYREDYRNIYEGPNASIEEFFSRQMRYGRGILGFVKETILNLKGLKVLDVGCGSGGILNVFKQEMAICYGLDMDVRYTSYGRNLGLTILDPESIDAIPTMDLVIMSHVLEHVTDPRALLKKAKNQMKENGSLYIEVPYVVPRRELLGLLQNAHVWYFDLPLLKNLLNECGFKIVSVSINQDHMRTLSVPIQSRTSFYSYKKWLSYRIVEMLRLVKG